MTLEEKAKEWRKHYKPMGVTCVERCFVTVETQAKSTRIIENPNPFRIKDGWYDLYLKDLENAYIAGAEPREKQIAELEDKLANADYQLEGRDNEIRELKAQIEKMKRCAICKYSTDLGYCKIRCSGGECDNYSSWEIEEK